MTETDMAHEVIMIGAGIAGLVAANRAAQLGKRVVVLEKSEDERYLCNSRYTYGTFHINFTDVGADEDVLFGKIEACSEGFARKDLARAIAKDGRRLMQWLKNEGIDLVDLGGYQTNVLAPPWRQGFGLTWRGYAGDVALQRLEENLRQRQGRILRGMRARALKFVSRRIEVETDAAAGAARFSASSVVIADGGFQASFDLIRTHICPAPEKLLARNGGSATSDGLRMAQAVGAASAGLDMFYGHLHSRDAMSSTRLWPRPYVDERRRRSRCAPRKRLLRCSQRLALMPRRVSCDPYRRRSSHGIFQCRSAGGEPEWRMLDSSSAPSALRAELETDFLR
jgi:fumarate reductase flavoprotein subunit